MKRRAVIKKLKLEARRRGLEFEEIPLRRHDAYRVGSVTRTLGRHSEIDDLTARKFSTSSKQNWERDGGDEHVHSDR